MRHLDRHVLVDPGVLCKVDDAEATASEGSENLVFTEDLTSKEHASAASIAEQAG